MLGATRVVSVFAFVRSELRLECVRTGGGDFSLGDKDFCGRGSLEDASGTEVGWS